MVTLGCGIAGTGNTGLMSFTVTGPTGFTPLAADADRSLIFGVAAEGFVFNASRSFLVTTTIPGAYTFRAQFATLGGALDFYGPTVIVQPVTARVLAPAPGFSAAPAARAARAAAVPLALSPRFAKFAAGRAAGPAAASTDAPAAGPV
jgi:hypothetical protein